MFTTEEPSKRNTLVIYPTVNQHKKDATGTFIPEANGFIKRRVLNNEIVQSFTFEPKKFHLSNVPDLYAKIQSDSFETVAILSHGMPYGLTQLHIRRADCADFAKALTANLDGSQELTLILYCCLLADTKYPNQPNFARTLAGELHAIGKPFKMFAHRSASPWSGMIGGHATRNPYITLFTGSHELEYPNEIDDPKKRKAFRRRLGNKNDLYRFDYPFELPTRLTV